MGHICVPVTDPAPYVCAVHTSSEGQHQKREHSAGTADVLESCYETATQGGRDAVRSGGSGIRLAVWHPHARRGSRTLGSWWPHLRLADPRLNSHSWRLARRRGLRQSVRCGAGGCGLVCAHLRVFRLRCGLVATADAQLFYDVLVHPRSKGEGSAEAQWDHEPRHVCPREDERQHRGTVAAVAQVGPVAGRVVECGGGDGEGYRPEGQPARTCGSNRCAAAVSARVAAGRSASPRSRRGRIWRWRRRFALIERGGFTR